MSDATKWSTWHWDVIVVATMVVFGIFVAEAFVVHAETVRHGGAANVRLHAYLLAIGGVAALAGLSAAGGFSLRLLPALIRGEDLNPRRGHMRSIVVCVLASTAGLLTVCLVPALLR